MNCPFQLEKRVIFYLALDLWTDVAMTEKYDKLPKIHFGKQQQQKKAAGNNS